MEKLFTVRLGDGFVEILDQTLLPNTIEYKKLRAPEDIYEAIRSTRVRGAPAIGITAAFGMYVIALNIPIDGAFLDKFGVIGAFLSSARPTARNLSYAVKRMLSAAERAEASGFIYEELKDECEAIYEEEAAACRAISENGMTLIKDGYGILTHCNAGALAACEYGTGLGALLMGKEHGMDFHVYCDETRPLLQGARLTAFELTHAGIDTTLICDSAASLLMKQGKINAVFVGCDRVAANGDIANKIGTRSVAINARYHDIPFYVFCPGSSIDFSCKKGNDIVIEERSGDEIKSLRFTEPIAEPEVKCYNPAFDVTDAELITAIITEKGIARYPYIESLEKMFAE